MMRLFNIPVRITFLSKLPIGTFRGILGILSIATIASLVEILAIVTIGPLFAFLISGNLVGFIGKLSNILYEYFFSNSLQIEIFYAFSILLIFTIKTAFSYLSQALLMSYGNKQRYLMSTFVYEKLLRLDYLLLNSLKKSSILNIISSEVNFYSTHIVLPIITLIAEVLITLSIIVCLVILYPGLALSVLTVIFFFGIIFFLLTKKALIRSGKTRTAHENKRVQLSLNTLESREEIALSSHKQTILEMFDFSSENVRSSLTKLGYIQLLPRYILEYFCVFALIIAIVVYSNSSSDTQLLSGIISIGVGLLRLAPSFAKINTNIALLNFGNKSVNDLGSFIQLPVTRIVSDVQNLPKIADISVSRIILKNIGFSYQGVELFKDTSLTANAGDRIGIYGASGCGKSTLLKVICGLMPVSSGSISYMTNMGSKVSFPNFNTVSYVAQTPFVFDGTIQDNLLFFEPPELDTHIRLNQALEMSCCKEIWPEKSIENILETEIKASSLSGGQKQRIAIARAIYRKSSIYIFDEATSALDSSITHQVLENIKSMLADKICFFVTHDNSLIKHFNSTLIVENQSLVVYEESRWTP